MSTDRTETALDELNEIAADAIDRRPLTESREALAKAEDVLEQYAGDILAALAEAAPDPLPVGWLHRASVRARAGLDPVPPELGGRVAKV